MARMEPAFSMSEKRNCRSCRYFKQGENVMICDWVNGMAQSFIPAWLWSETPIRDPEWGDNCRAWRPKDE